MIMCLIIFLNLTCCVFLCVWTPCANVIKHFFAASLSHPKNKLACFFQSKNFMLSMKFASKAKSVG